MGENNVYSHFIAVPVTVSPDIFGIREVLLSVVILGAIVATCDERAETKNLIDQRYVHSSFGQCTA